MLPPGPKRVKEKPGPQHGGNRKRPTRRNFRSGRRQSERVLELMLLGLGEAEIAELFRVSMTAVYKQTAAVRNEHADRDIAEIIAERYREKSFLVELLAARLGLSDEELKALVIKFQAQDRLRVEQRIRQIESEYVGVDS